jgi:heme exporter protein B
VQAYWAILAKDLRTELRTRQTIVAAFVFSMLVLLVFNFSFELRGADLITLAPGVLWATFIFNGMIALGRLFIGEYDNAVIEGLILAPIDRGVVFLAKCTFVLLLMVTVELVTLLVFGAIFDVNAFAPLILLDVLLGSAGFAAVGTSLSVVAFNSRARDVMLPVLLLPLVVPVIVGAVRVTSLVLSAAPAGEAVGWLNLLFAFDALFVVVCYYSFGFLLGG